MTDTSIPAGYKLVESGTLMLFEILKTDIKPTVGDEDKIVATGTAACASTLTTSEAAA
jgi:hypothetical protein